ncbi:class I SAM-dependent methyltransferase [Weissella confusa]|uniref:Glucose-inhibited division protein B n=1 Tax=Weissella confusa TaxID=1583 RepID=A0A923SNP7_WEICO|nr:class I SAM-dependent methyltransferase [Weissella confusa]
MEGVTVEHARAEEFGNKTAPASLREHNVELNAQQLAQYQQYYERLVAVNEHMNLTAITERDEVYLKHFYDSLTLAWAYPELQTEELHPFNEWFMAEIARIK